MSLLVSCPIFVATIEVHLTSASHPSCSTRGQTMATVEQRVEATICLILRWHRVRASQLRNHVTQGKKPFPPQLALMSKFLLSVRRGGNCLLESPTGTGKTLALLCASLAWQRDQKGKEALVDEHKRDREEDGNFSTQVLSSPTFEDFRYVGTGLLSDPPPQEKREQTESPVKLEYDCGVQNEEKVETENEDVSRWLDEQEQSVFQSAKRRKTRRHVKNLLKREASTPLIEGEESPVEGEKLQAFAGHPKLDRNTVPRIMHTNVEQGATRRTTGRRLPKVYYCSRTHSQLTQVVAELRTCESSFPAMSAVGLGGDEKPFSMTLLASRKNTCINTVARTDPKGVDDACKRLLQEKMCNYQKRSTWGLTKLPPVWDVEDLVQLGKHDRTCPYYTARYSLVDADVVLCPYNYLIDPNIREMMGMKLKNAVVIFDEAHNLEDSAREAASAKISLRALSSASREMQQLGAALTWATPAYNILQKVVMGLKHFLEEADGNLSPDEYERAYKVYSGEEALGLMESRVGITAESIPHLKDALNFIKNEDPRHISHNWGKDFGEGQGTRDESSFEAAPCDALSSSALSVIMSLVKILAFLLTEGRGNAQHYRMVTLRERGPRGPFGPSSGRERSGRRRDHGGGFGTSNVFGRMETYICFWCQSASVCFAEIDKLVHSIVLTSGTLSPMDSFAGELGIDFEHRLEAPHVINVTKQCLIHSVGSFGAVSLDSRYANQHNLRFQDSLGNALLAYARVVPCGMLVFFPSYGLMEKVHNRWKVTGLLHDLESIKALFMEPRGQGDIDGVLSEYYTLPCHRAYVLPRPEAQAASKAGKERDEEFKIDKQDEHGHRTGALMLAVARGKVSEGINFSDDAARICIVVGIPYPNSKDLQVMLKKEYQTRRGEQKPHMGGGAWYNLQAFRAVNQAIGRCIRHRNDFGAIVLCDPRYSSGAETTASLTKWVRSSLRPCSTVEVSVQQVDAFFQQKAESKLGNLSCPPTPPDPDLGHAGKRPLTTDPRSPHSCLEGGASKGTKGWNPVYFGGGNEDDADSNHATSSRKEADARRLTPQMEWATTRSMRHESSPGAIETTGSDNFCDTETQDTAHSMSEEDARLSSIEGCRTTRPSRRPGLYCEKLGQPSGALAYEPTGLCGVGKDGDRSSKRAIPRQVMVEGDCHLYRVAKRAQGERDEWEGRVELLEIPKDWVLGELVSEGEGQWVAADALVFAPLHCKAMGAMGAMGGGSLHVGERVIGAGLRGTELIGSMWFFACLVHAEGVDLKRAEDDFVPLMSDT